MTDYIGPIGAQQGEVIDLSPEVADRINSILDDADVRAANQSADEKTADAEYMAALSEAKSTGKLHEFMAAWYGSDD